MNDDAQVNQLFNFIPDREGRFHNSQRGRVYGIDGIAPCLNTVSGGGLEPKILIEDNMNTRLVQMIEDGQIPEVNGLYIDTYNKSTNPDVAGTIRTTIDTANMHYIQEIDQIPLNTDVDDCAFTITTRYGAMCFSNLYNGCRFPMTAVIVAEDEPCILTALRSEEGRRLRRQGVDTFAHKELFPRTDGIANTLTSVTKDNLLLETIICAIGAYKKDMETKDTPQIQPLVPWNRPGDPTEICPTITTSAFEHNNVVIEPMVMHDPRKSFGKVAPSAEASPTLLATDYKSPHLVIEGDKEQTEPRRKDLLRFEEQDNGNIHAVNCKDPSHPHAPEWNITHPDNAAPTVTTSHEPKVIENADPRIVGYSRDEKGHIVSRHLKEEANTLTTYTGSGNSMDQYVAEGQVIKRKRIRKLTERECLRLMDVSEDDIDKILSSGVSKSAAYKLAGNSICQNVLYHIFKQLFAPKISENQQLSLF